MNLETAEELNTWLDSTFAVFIAPARAYFELPFSVALNGDPAVVGFRRVIHVTLALKGEQDLAAQQIQRAISRHVLREQLQDGVAPIFIRQRFVWNPEVQILRGRIAFWDAELQAKLRTERCCVGEYHEPLPVERKKEV